MNLEKVTKEIRDLLSQFVSKMKANAALGLTDLNHFSEGFLLDLLKEVYALPDLRNLNSERSNFPGLDLGDDKSGSAFQITSTTDLSKIKSTLQTVIDAGLHNRFSRIQIFILTEKQSTYSQSSVNQVTNGLIKFNTSKDIVDYRDILSLCAHFPLERLIRVHAVLQKHLSESQTGSVKISNSVNVPDGYESVELNLAHIWPPPALFTAVYIPPVKSDGNVKGRRRRKSLNPREVVARDILARGFPVPEDFEIYGNQLISFQDLSKRSVVLDPYFDQGTAETLKSSEFYGIDESCLRVYKSLLRRCLQRQLRRIGVKWQRDRHLFFFCPEHDEQERKVTWTGMKIAERVVYKRTMKNNKPDEILNCKHLAFYVDFELIDGGWYISITPDWYFSRDGYSEDHYASKNISWLKRKENNQQVHTHFRFILHQLRALQEESLFDRTSNESQMQVGDPVSFSNHPVLPDHLWNPSPDQNSSDDANMQGRIEL